MDLNMMAVTALMWKCLISSIVGLFFTLIFMWMMMDRVKKTNSGGWGMTGFMMMIFSGITGISLVTFIVMFAIKILNIIGIVG